MLNALIVLYTSNGFASNSISLFEEKRLSKNLYSTEIEYQPPGWFDWLTHVPSNLKNFVIDIKPQKNYRTLAYIFGSTFLLVHYDQKILDESQSFARKLGLIDDDTHGRETHTLIDWRIGGKQSPLLAPANLNSFFYYIGDGLTHLGVVIGFASYCWLNNNARALSTASQIVETLFVTGIVIQVLKRITGREAPFKSTGSGGKWQWFPDQKKYEENVPKYDAFPSGHLATVMATMTIVADNYPEYTYIRLLGYTLMTLLGFGVLNNGVHWAGDYPLAIAIGYHAAKVVGNRYENKRKLPVVNKRYARQKNRFLILPELGANYAAARAVYLY